LAAAAALVIAGETALVWKILKDLWRRISRVLRPDGKRINIRQLTENWIN
jgi:hypothetical protein